MNPLALVVDVLINTFRILRNLVARVLPGPEFVVLTARGTLPERRVARRGFLQRLIPNPLGPIAEESLEEWRERLRILAQDPRVRGIVLKVDDLRAGLASIEGLRTALERFRAAGKRIAAYLVSSALHGYYLASVADEVIVPPSAELILNGPRVEMTFFRIALDRLGVLPEFHHVGEYKSASHRVLYPEMTGPQREMQDALVGSYYREIVGAIARSRGLSEAHVREAIDQGILAGEGAKASGLATTVAYEDDLPRLLGSERPARILPWAQARNRVRLPLRWRVTERDEVAVVQLIGAITPGESRDLPVPIPLLGPHLAGHETVIRALRTAESNPSVKAVVFHVDSGGGSPVASDVIWREVVRVQQHKPVVVYIGNVAASGGYYVICGAKHIVAAATSVTGSIGVVAGKFNARPLFERLGLNREIISRGATAAMFSAFTDFTEQEWGVLRDWMQDVYARFKSRVAAGRGQDVERVESVARGRVYTGRQALEAGLIDELGDLETAVRKAKALAGIPDGVNVPVVTVRPPKAAAMPELPAAVWTEGLRQAVRLFQEPALLIAPVETGFAS
jgi:protease-4